MSQKIRSTVAFLAILVLSAGAVSALPMAAVPYEPSGLVTAAWGWLTSLAGRVGGLWEKEGSSMDPNGQPGPGSPNKAGADMDPNGLNATPCPTGTTTTSTCTPTTAAGSDMDPDGVR